MLESPKLGVLGKLTMSFDNGMVAKKALELGSLTDSETEVGDTIAVVVV